MIEARLTRYILISKEKDYLTVNNRTKVTVETVI